MSQQSIVVEELLERVQDDKELMLELLDIFVEDFSERRPKFEQIINDGDYDSMGGHAHALKGASGNISVPSMRAIFTKMEDFSKAKEKEPILALLPDLDQEFEAFKVHAEELKKQYS